MLPTGAPIPDQGQKQGQGRVGKGIWGSVDHPATPTPPDHPIHSVLARAKFLQVEARFRHGLRLGLDN